MMCFSEGDKDTAPAVCSEKSVGGSSQLHLWTERGLSPPVQGAEGCHVSVHTHTHILYKHKNTQKCPYPVFVSLQIESATLQHQLNTIQKLAVLPVPAAPS